MTFFATGSKTNYLHSLFRLLPENRGGYGAYSIYLDDFSVTAAYRNKGIGSDLLRAAEAYAGETGSRAVILHVEKTNTSAMCFYERSGYSIFRDNGNRFLLKKDME